jgi:hypothetical protein
MRLIFPKNQVPRRTSYQKLGDCSDRSSLLFYLMPLVFLVGCGFKSVVEVSSSCGKPQDPACRKAQVKSYPSLDLDEIGSREIEVLQNLSISLTSHAQREDFELGLYNFTCTLKTESYNSTQDCGTVSGSFDWNGSKGTLNWTPDLQAAPGGYKRSYLFTLVAMSKSNPAVSDSLNVRVDVSPPRRILDLSFDSLVWPNDVSTASIGSTLSLVSAAKKHSKAAAGLRAQITNGSTGFVTTSNFTSRKKFAIGFWIRVNSIHNAQSGDEIVIADAGNHFKAGLLYSSAPQAGWRAKLNDNNGSSVSSAVLQQDAWNYLIFDVSLHPSLGSRAIYVDGIERTRDEGLSNDGDVRQIEKFGAASSSSGNLNVIYDISNLAISDLYQGVQPGIDVYNFEVADFGEFLSKSVGTTIFQSSEAAIQGNFGMRVISLAGSNGNVRAHPFGPQQTVFVGMWLKIHDGHSIPESGSPYTSIFRSPGSTSNRPDGWYRYYASDGFMSYMFHNTTGNIKAPNAKIGSYNYVVWGTRTESNQSLGFRRLYVDGQEFSIQNNLNNTQAIPTVSFDFGPVFTSGGLTMTYDIDEIKIGYSFDSVRPEMGL